jgi:hypothetical protein
MRIAYGVDPVTKAIAFITQVTDLGGFLKALVENASVKPFTVVVPVTPPDTPWPKAQVVIAYAQSITSDEKLAQVQA